IPKESVSKSLNRGEITEEPAGQVNQMRALINELAAACKLGIGPPLPVIADPSAVTVKTADKHQLPDGTGIDEFTCLAHRAMKAVVDPDAHRPSPMLGRHNYGFDLGGEPARGLLH